MLLHVFSAHRYMYTLFSLFVQTVLIWYLSTWCQWMLRYRPTMKSESAYHFVVINFCLETSSSSGPKNYRNDPKFLDRYAWANSGDPDQQSD